MKPVRMSALALVLFAALISSSARIGAQQPIDGAANGISPEALAQIDALVAEKDSRSAAERKVDSQLLYENRMDNGVPIADGIWTLATDVPYANDGHAVVDVYTQPGTDVAARWRAAGFEVLATSPDGAAFRAHVDVAAVVTLAGDPDVLFIQPQQRAIVTGQDSIANLVAPTGQGSRSSEGDVTHLAFAARGAFHIDGTGVKIGVLSDGVTSLAASQARGDLGTVTVLPGQTGSGDEGTAMLEIIHDLAPGAQLYFATAFSGISQFAQNIRDLRTAGCDIIVDDVFYFVETPFQDGQPAPTTTNGGVVIQAVNDVTSSGALYFSSAGNSGNLDAGTSGTWEGDFVDGGATGAPLPAGNRVHRFNATQAFNVITAATTNPTNLYWSDPLGASGNDYDLFRLNSAGTTVLASSTNIQSGTQDPYEQTTCGGGSPCAAGQRIVIVKKASAQPRFLHLGTNRGRLQIATMGETHGHAAAANAYDVAATPAVGPFPQPFNSTNVVETFSSDGPRRVFYVADGTPYTPGDVSSTGGVLRQKPDVTAADGVTVTGVGGFGSPFFGTSAAAPHAAAIAGLVKSANLALTPAQIRSILTSTAIDIQAPGVDRDSGAGIVMARGALIATGVPGTAFLAVDSVQASDNPGNGNGLPEAGEGAKLLVTLKNYGVAPATAISGALTSSTAGITIALPNTAAFPDLAPLASATSGPLLFTTASDFGCPGSAGFTFGVTYGGGGPLSQPFSIPIGVTSYTMTKRLDGTAPAASPGVIGSTGFQNARLNRQDTASVCGALKPPPPISAAGGPGRRAFDAYAFTTCSFSAPSCVSVTFSGPNSINMFSAAYAPTFDPTNITANYKADPAVSSGGPLTYSFDLPAGSSQFAIDVHDVPVLATPPSNSPYTLTVANACLGSCEPPNHPPVAKVKNVTVSANNACVADASIDNGSFDPDGDPLTFAQAPPSPYSLGVTSVLLTVTDPKGAFSQAGANVTVVDTTGPTVTPLVLSPAGPLWPPNHQMVDVTVSYGATDNCGSASCVLTVSSNEAVNGAGDGNTSPDWQVLDANHVRLRAERAGGGSGRIYTITATCSDEHGNQTVRTATVVVPHNQ